LSYSSASCLYSLSLSLKRLVPCHPRTIQESTSTNNDRTALAADFFKEIFWLKHLRTMAGYSGLCHYALNSLIFPRFLTPRPLDTSPPSRNCYVVFRSCYLRDSLARVYMGQIYEFEARRRAVVISRKLNYYHWPFCIALPNKSFPMFCRHVT